MATPRTLFPDNVFGPLRLGVRAAFLEVRKSLTILGDPVFLWWHPSFVYYCPPPEDREKTESLTILGDPTFCGGILRSCMLLYPEVRKSLTILGDPTVYRGGTLRSCITVLGFGRWNSLTISGTRPHKLMWLVASRSCISVQYPHC